MKIQISHATRALLLVALPLSAVAASAQAQGARSSITYFDKNGNAIIQPTSNGDGRSSVTTFDKDGNPIITPTSGDQNRSSVTTFDKNGVPTITYTSPPFYPNPTPSGIQTPQSIAGLIANQNIYGQSAPNPTPGNYRRFDYYNHPVYPPGYYPYPAPPAYGYPVPAYPVQQSPSTVIFNDSTLPWVIPGSVTSIPLTPGYAYPGPAYPSYPYPAPTYPYPAPGYGYPASGYGYPAPSYPYGYGYGYGNGTYSSNTANYGVRFGRGGFSASVGGSNTTTRSNSSTTITIR